MTKPDQEPVAIHGMASLRAGLEDLAERGQTEDEPVFDDDEFDDDECGMTSDGTCLLAGSEFCDWDCPYSR